MSLGDITGCLYKSDLFAICNCRLNIQIRGYGANPRLHHAACSVIRILHKFTQLAGLGIMKSAKDLLTFTHIQILEDKGSLFR